MSTDTELNELYKMRANQMAALASTDKLIAAKVKESAPKKKKQVNTALLAQVEAKHYKKLGNVPVRQ